MTVLLYALGVLLFLAGISASIALHELGHLVPAKRFGVKVTKYMVGFGPTLFSRVRGETEYGVKALPLGGFISMPGMYPPPEALDRAPRSPRFLARTVADAREFSNEDLAPGEEHRSFYALSVPKRLVVMFGGPCVNLVLGIGIFAISLMGIGAPAPTTTVQTVVECAVPAETAAERPEDAGCLESDPLTPAWELGVQPGDTVVSVDGVATEDWDTLSETIRDRAGSTVPVVLERGGERLTLDVPIMETERPVEDADGEPVLGEDGEIVTEPAGFLGIGPTQEYERQTPAQFAERTVEAVGLTFRALVTLPAKLAEVAEVAFSDAERPEDSPVGLVGVGRIAGEIVSTDEVETASGTVVDVEVVDKVQSGLGLLASLNLFLFAFNMVPLLPLDGGHIAVAIYEGARRRISRIRGRGPTGPFDTAKLLPLTYAVVVAFLGMTLLLLYVDIVKPLRLYG
ncbi:M50 family metallopeptidase [Brevibacterium album]|uniref:M50 family metallopeptidase n=1 Tax=Brevibacterium album TaxID=417948 RepID=UPI0004213D24|nr:site-2 protease family protein [Brevibacterium album]